MALAAPREINLTLLVLGPKFLGTSMAHFRTAGTTNGVQGIELQSTSSSWKAGLERFPANHTRPRTLRTKRGSLTGGQGKEQKTSPLALGQSRRTAWRGQALMKQY